MKFGCALVLIFIPKYPPPPQQRYTFFCLPTFNNKCGIIPLVDIEFCHVVRWGASLNIYQPTLNFSQQAQSR